MCYVHAHVPQMSKLSCRRSESISSILESILARASGFRTSLPSGSREL
jgi:hypothetical protein